VQKTGTFLLRMKRKKAESRKPTTGEVHEKCRISGFHGGDYEKRCLLGCSAV
jgi:hypothetical protein